MGPRDRGLAGGAGYCAMGHLVSSARAADLRSVAASAFGDLHTRMEMPHHALLDELFCAAIRAAHPATCLVGHLPAPPTNGRLIVLAAGKAAGSMAQVAEQHYLEQRDI